VSLRDIQVKAIDFFTRDNNNLLVVFGTGVGKTITALISSLCYLDMYPRNRVIVIAPKSVQHNFQKEMLKYSGGLYGLDERFKLFTFTKFSNLVKNRQISCRNSLVIIDEVHNLRNIKSVTVKNILKCTDIASKKMFLTATPYVNDIKDIYTIIMLLYHSSDLIYENNWEYFLKDHVIYQPKIIDENFPKTKEQYLYIDMEPEYQRRYLDAITENFWKNMNNPSSFYNGYRRLVNNNFGGDYTNSKINAVVNIINSDTRKQNLIYTTWLEYGIDILVEAMNYNNISFNIITGQTKNREQIIDDFNLGMFNTLLITSAGSEGIDLKNVENVFIFDPVWNPSGIEQIIGRAVRYKSHLDLPFHRRVVNIYYLILKEHDVKLDELEESLSGDVILYRIVERKRQEQDKILETLGELSI
jgi:superfamily II DNA or RNA helicase